jgi:glutamate dehydrogenase
MTSKSTSLVFSKVPCVIPTIYDDIMRLAENKNIGPLYAAFISKFYRYIPADYVTSEAPELFNDIAKEAFGFFEIRVPTERKLLIEDSSIKHDPAITILLINDNKPFIVDSLNTLLTTLSLQPKFIFHPVIACTRDEQGNIKSIENHTQDSRLESLVVMKILGKFEKDYLQSLEKQINKILDQVGAVNDIWQGSLSHIINLAKNFEQNLEYYENLGLPVKESIDFLHWLCNHNFTFLGKVDFDINSAQFLQEGATSIWENNIDEIKNIIRFSAREIHRSKLVILGSINVISTVHLSNLVDYILIRKFNDKGQYVGGSIILGLYSSMLSYQLIKHIPILREKLHFILDKAGFASNGYNYKKLKIIIESLPREALIQTDQDDLYCMCLHMLSSMMSRKLKLFVQRDWSSAFINILIFLPRERLSPAAHNAIIKYLSQKFQGSILTNYITEVVQNFSYLFVTIAVKTEINFDIEQIEQDINHISTLWDESLYQELSQKFGEYKAYQESKNLQNVFSGDYKHRYSAKVAIADIEYLREASRENKPLFNLSVVGDTDFTLRIYSPENPLALYNILPSIENLGFRAIDERSFEIEEAQDIKKSWIYEFIITSINKSSSHPELDSRSELPANKIMNQVQDDKFSSLRSTLKQNVEEALDKMMSGDLAVDSLSKLIVLASLNWCEVKLLKALTRYLHQTGFTYGKGYVQLTLIKHFKFTKLLVEFFDAKFNPATVAASSKNTKAIANKITSYLNNVEVSTEDKVLKSMFNLITAMLRTNWYQSGTISDRKNYISFKFNSKEILDLPRPVPYAEIFVYSNEFEAVHLRGGKIARGGLRWSDRGEDYRTEVLGLMKAQMTKNSVIIPVGSKGGFFLLFGSENYTPEEYKKKAIECYQNFLRGMLDITDNIVDGKIVKPQNVVTYDEDDPYLVVAADKGTATFSDYANTVSAEYNFWLVDAFASGGSAGYDHKKMGITAKGAWISVVKHFEKMAIDVATTPITVVGIGDMSGDVFGNGMLISKAIKLVAAFNHMHIFLDPTPDPLISFEERTRLFNLPYSKWSDYNPKLLSKGGAIFERSAKSLKLTSEINNLLDIDPHVNEMTPEELIKAILKARVDLTWNGGIGTYIKAINESHLEIGDKANDALRCNGHEIRAKVIAEGGNLGVSQQGRIEYSLAGGLINTDFIDNSAGVDCSDHEVNIKIALNAALRSKKLTLDERNRLLAAMSPEIEELVLLDNYKQTQAITIAHSSSAFTTEVFSEFINALEEEKILDRAVEFLPSQDEMKKRSASNVPLTRPELAVLLAYSKMSCYNELSAFDLFKNNYFETCLVNYFPPEMQDKFKHEILQHPLKEEIIRTVVTNKIVNQVGGPIINTLKKETGATIADIVSTYIITCEIFDLDELWDEVEKLGPNIDYHIKIDMFTELTKVMRRGCSWFIKNIPYPIVDIQKTIKSYEEAAKNLSKTVGGLLSGEAKGKYNERIERYTAVGIDKKLAARIASLDNFISVFDIISIATASNANPESVAKLYFLTGSYFYIDFLRKASDKLIDSSYWNRLSIQSLKDDLYEKQKHLLIRITQDAQPAKIDLESWVNDKKAIVNIFTDFVKNIKLHENINLNMIILANKKFEMFLRKLN